MLFSDVQSRLDTIACAPMHTATVVPRHASRDRESSSTGENASVYVRGAARGRRVRAATRAHPRSVHGVTFVTARALFVWRGARREFAAFAAELEIS
jgi:hypothetical protein